MESSIMNARTVIADALKEVLDPLADVRHLAVSPEPPKEPKP